MINSMKRLTVIAKVCLSVCAFFVSVSSVRADRTDILVTENKSWITNENFTKIIKLSFSSSKCCNVILSDPMKHSEALFGQFRSIYPYEYLLKPCASECRGYFLLASNDNEVTKSITKIPSLEWNTEILVMVNSNISSDSVVLDHSMYGIANVVIVSMSGVWRLSENYLKPRVFIQVDRHQETSTRKQNINLRGREIQVSSIYQPPMTYLNHTVVKTIDGEQAEVYAMDTVYDWDGIEMHLFLILAEKLNFTWTIRKPDGNYTYGKRVNETVWKGGMIQMLTDHKVDMAFGSIWVTYDQNTFVQLSEPWYQVFITFLVPRPRRTTSFWALTKPFSKQIWYLLVSALLLHSVYTYVRAWIDPHFPKRFRSFSITLIDLIGCLLSSSVPKTIAANKLQVLLWRTAGWLIISAYCSSLAARLSSLDYKSRVDTVEQFLRTNLTWGEVGQEPPFGDYFDLTDPYSAQLPSRYRHLENSTQSKEFIKQGNYAILGKIMDTCFFPHEYVSNEDLKNYRMMKQSVGHYYTAFAVQPWLLKPVNRIMLWLKETGIIIWHLRDVIRRRDSYNLREVLVEHDGYDGSVQVLGLTPLGAGFSLLIVGSSIATLVFYLELKRAARSVSVRKLRDTERKHGSRNKTDDAKSGSSKSSGFFQEFIP